MADEKSGQVTLKQGMPPQQSNGLYGAEDRLITLGVNGRVTAVVEFDVADIIHSEAKDATRPVVELARIEPLWSKEQIAAARTIHEEAYKERTGANQLNFDGLSGEPADEESQGEDLGGGKTGQF